ncbi:FAD-dependent oxidoreductase [Paraburkholderia fungorum]|uniref:FAD-dependent oxidoreductase n=1 Tax=Paraburkholderia fungorum TaxID=134537 RepID=UPI0038B6E495
MSQILIAGCGIAGCAMALRAMQLGFTPTLLKCARPEIGGVEIIPASARNLLAELGLDPAIASVHPGLSNCMVSYSPDSEPHFTFGRALYVDRLALRAAVLEEARSRGAKIRCVDRLPPRDTYNVTIDATGQFAAWSRPVVRYGRSHADIFLLPHVRGRPVARVLPIERGWAYVASDETHTTVGAISYAPCRSVEVEHALRRALGLDPEDALRHLGRRPAFPQATATPLHGRTIAIGDAAFSHDPIGGRGIAFALGSAFAAGAVLQTWRDWPADTAAAADYYRGYVQAEIGRHLRFLAGASEIESTAVVDMPSHVHWCARETRCAIAMPDRITFADAVSTNRGSVVRWLGKLDIFTLRAICRGHRTVNEVIARLCDAGLTPEEASSAIKWALGHGVLHGPGVNEPE